MINITVDPGSCVRIVPQLVIIIQVHADGPIDQVRQISSIIGVKQGLIGGAGYLRGIEILERRRRAAGGQGTVTGVNRSR